MKRILTMMAMLAATALVSAHVTVAPQQAPAGGTQTYKVRVHNDGKTATASIVLHVPNGVAIQSVAPVAAPATFETAKTGERITAITWKIAVPVGKYVELAFDAKNPANAAQVNWNVTETFGDGKVIEFSDKPGAAEKSSTTKLIKP